MAEHNDTGKKAEELAKQFLIDKGHALLHFNWQFGHREIDIISEHKNMLIVTEVKGRIAGYYGGPTEILSVKKMKHLVYAAEAYVNKFNIDLEVRFDLVVVLFGKEKEMIEHFESVFIAGVNW